VAERQWPEKSDIRLMMVLNPSMLANLQVASSAGASISARSDLVGNGDDLESLDGMIGRMMAGYRSILAQNPSGVTISTSLVAGDPKRILIDEAETWGADSIFIGSRGLSGWEKFLLGSVSSAVAVRAHCSVEVVRASHSSKE
jgi:nucleotide-binding universal stress UspA family protein